jgi:hypothetical protein
LSYNTAVLFIVTLFVVFMIALRHASLDLDNTDPTVGSPRSGFEAYR